MNDTNEKGDNKIFILTFLGLLILALIFVAGYYYYKDTKKDSSENTQEESEQEDETTDESTENSGEETNNGSIYEIALDMENASQFNSILENSEVSSNLQDLEQNFTLILPQDKTYENEDLIISDEKLEDLVKAYISSEVISPEDLLTENEKQIKDLNENNLTFKVENGIILINNHEVIEFRTDGKNGVVYIVNGLLN